MHPHPFSHSMKILSKFSRSWRRGTEIKGDWKIMKRGTERRLFFNSFHHPKPSYLNLLTWEKVGYLPGNIVTVSQR